MQSAFRTDFSIKREVRASCQNGSSASASKRGGGSGAQGRIWQGVRRRAAARNRAVASRRTFCCERSKLAGRQGRARRQQDAAGEDGALLAVKLLATDLASPIVEESEIERFLMWLHARHLGGALGGAGVHTNDQVKRALERRLGCARPLDFCRHQAGHGGSARARRGR